MVYNITFTGSPAKKMKFELKVDDQTAGVTIRIAYPDATSKNIVKKGQIVNYNPWIEIDKQYGPVTQSFCGENRYIGVKNILEFYITPGCVLRVQPRDAI